MARLSHSEVEEQFAHLDYGGPKPPWLGRTDIASVTMPREPRAVLGRHES